MANDGPSRFQIVHVASHADRDVSPDPETIIRYSMIWIQLNGITGITTTLMNLRMGIHTILASP